MTYKISLNLILGAGAALALAACAATPDTPSATTVAAQKAAPEEAVVYEAPKNDKEKAILTANDLSITKSVKTSEDGEMRCKFQAVVGSKFRRKVCMTNDQWDALAAQSQENTNAMQRRRGTGAAN